MIKKKVYMDNILKLDNVDNESIEFSQEKIINN